MDYWLILASLLASFWRIDPFIHEFIVVPGFRVFKIEDGDDGEFFNPLRFQSLD